VASSQKKTVPDLERIRKEAAAPRRERLRIVITSGASQPIRSLTLPRGLPRAVTIVVVVLLLGTAALIVGSWHMNGSLARLEGRVQEMVQAADMVALHPLPDAVTVGSLDDGAASAARRPTGEKGHFIIESVNTGESVDVRIDLASGEVEASCYRALRHLMRCLRTGAETPMDPRLVELLYRISQRTHQKIQMVSGFRAPMFSLATLSYHTRGMAADIRVPGMTPLMVRDLVRSMGVKGIGYYPVSKFVHVDVRDQHQEWTDYGQNRFDAEGGEHDPNHAQADEP
jgi:uncharacterized protein YcbK (DUF882 family)